MDGRDGVIQGDGKFELSSDSPLESPKNFEEIDRPPLRQIDKYMQAKCPCLSQRYTIALMACLGFIILFGMHCNIGMAKLQLEHELHNTTILHHNNARNMEISFKWSFAMKSAVDSSFFWGFMISQVPGGILASVYPANKIFGIAIAWSCFLHLFLPGAIEMRGIFTLIRFIQGLIEGLTFSACHGMWSFWAPPFERSRLATLAFSGPSAGILIGVPLSNILTGWVSWRAAFYFYGVVGLVWYGFWLWLSFEKPRYHPAISIQERNFIEKSLGDSVKLQKPTIASMPWLEILRSMPVYAIVVASFCRSWSFYLLILYQSKFLKHSFNYEIHEAGIFSALPYMLMTIVIPFGGILADLLRRKGIMSTTNVRKLFGCGGLGLEGLFFLCVAHSTTGSGALLALTFGVAFSGFAISGYNVNHLDIAPRYASLLMGISNGIGTIAGLLCPIAIDYLTRDRGDISSWTTVFTFAACIHFCGIAFYGIFASGELQSWAKPSLEEREASNPVAEDAAKDFSI